MRAARAGKREGPPSGAAAPAGGVGRPAGDDTETGLAGLRVAQRPPRRYLVLKLMLLCIGRFFDERAVVLDVLRPLLGSAALTSAQLRA
jgi:hypothetical protein